MLVEVVTKVFALFIRSWTDAWNRDEGQEGPVADQQRKANGDKSLGSKETEEQSRKEISHGDAMKHAGQINIFEAVRDSAHVKDAEQEQDYRTERNAFKGGDFA